MRTRFARAIRRGVEAAKRTRYGEEDDPYFKERSDIIWSHSITALGGNAKDGALALEAFDRTCRKLVNRAKSRMTTEERREASRVFKRCRRLWFETSSERAYRLVEEEVAKLREELREHHENCDPKPS